MYALRVTRRGRLEARRTKDSSALEDEKKERLRNTRTEWETEKGKTNISKTRTVKQFQIHARCATAVVSVVWTDSATLILENAAFFAAIYSWT